MHQLAQQLQFHLAVWLPVNQLAEAWWPGSLQDGWWLRYQNDPHHLLTKWHTGSGCYQLGHMDTGALEQEKEVV